MRELQLAPGILSRILIFLVITFIMVAITQTKASEDVLISSCPALDTAARTFAGGRLDVAAQEFETLAQATSAPSFARGFALFGLANVALARQDFNAAIAAWERLTEDTRLLWFHRETAQRRIAEVKRLKIGLPARDPISYRVQLPALPTPGEVFYIAPNGSDSGDGSQKKPFRTMERARNAVRLLKQSLSGALPKGGVKIVITNQYIV